MAAKKKAEETKSTKKSEQTGLSRAERAAALMADVNKKFRGRAVLKSAVDYQLPWYTKRLPTGLLTLDLTLKGGWPAGGLSQIIGRKNSGKSLLAWHTIREMQRILGNELSVLLAMTEMAADRTQARAAGVQITLGKEEIAVQNEIRRLTGKPPLTQKEIDALWPQVGTIHELHALSAEDFYDVILSGIESNTYHLIVLDSIGNIMANAEHENESVHDKTYGGSSGPNTTFLKKMTNLLTMETEEGEVRDTCILAINQVRDNIKDPHKAYRAPGGNTLEHAKLVDLYIETGGAIGEHRPVYTIDGWKQQFVSVGKEVNWKIEKGKAGMHEGERGRFAFLFENDNIDFYTDAIVAGVTSGIIEQAGAWLGIRHPEKPDEYILRTQGKEAFVTALSQNPQVMSYIRSACFAKHGIHINYDSWRGGK